MNKTNNDRNFLVHMNGDHNDEFFDFSNIIEFSKKIFRMKNAKNKG